MAAKQFDPKQLAIICGGNQLTGYAEGTFINVEKDEDDWSLTVGSDGEGVRAKSNNNSATVTFTCTQGSIANDILSAFRSSDQLNNAGTFPFMMKDNNGRSLMVAETMWVQKPAAFEGSNEPTSREWVLRTDNLQILVAGL